MYIIGYKDYKKLDRALICANHLSAVDSFVIGHIFFPKAVSFPAKQELFKNPLISFILSSLNAFPVSRGYADLGLLKKISDTASKKLVLIHPEGTRQNVEKLGEAKRALGKIIYLGKLSVIPLYVRGTQNILPKGSIFLRFFKKTYINIGQPIDFNDLCNMEDNKETARLIAKRVMAEIQKLKTETENVINKNY